MSNAAINTSQEDDKGQEGHYAALLLLAFVVFSPITMLTAGLVYLLFAYVHIKRSVIALFSLPFFIIPLIFFTDAVNNFKDSWLVTFPDIFSRNLPAVEGFFQMLGEQMWIAIPVGILIGLGFASWRWYARARWQNIQFRRTPWEILKRRRIVKQIEHDENTPYDGMTLGVNEHGERAVQTYKEAGAHTLAIGGSGAGKTNTALMRIRDQIKNGDAVAVIDLKADPELTETVSLYAQRYGRKFQHFTLQDLSMPYDGPALEGNAHYDPLSRGDHTRRADMVLDLREWDNADFYKKLTQQYFQIMFAILIANPRKDISTLQDAINLMDPKELQKRAKPLATNPHLAPFVASIDKINDEKMSPAFRENLQTNRAQLEIYLQSIAGPWLTLDTKNNNNISLIDAAQNGDVVVFTLDSQAYPSLSANLANLIIQDLKTVSSELLKSKPERPFHVFIDEFSAIGSDNIIGLLNKARAADMYITLATQTLGDLMVNNPALSQQMMGIVSSFIIHRANTEDDSKVFSGLTNTISKTRVRQNVNYNQDLLGGIGTGIGKGTASVEEVDEWRIMPSEIQKLAVGEMFFISTVTQKFEKVQVILEKKGAVSTPEKTVPTKHVVQSEANEPVEMIQERLPADADMFHEASLVDFDPADFTPYALDEDSEPMSDISEHDDPYAHLHERKTPTQAELNPFTQMQKNSVPQAPVTVTPTPSPTPFNTGTQKSNKSNKFAPAGAGVTPTSPKANAEPKVKPHNPFKPAPQSENPNQKKPKSEFDF